MAAGGFKLKTLMILSFLLTWAAVAAAHVFYYAVARRDQSLTDARRIAWREAEIPALRGRILDRNGIPAAWSELYHELILERIPDSPRRRENLRQRMERVLPGAPAWTGKPPILLKSNLAPDEIVLFAREFRLFPEVRIVPAMRRVAAGSSEIRERIGKTAENNAGEIVGISGLERKYDMELSGRAGRVIVMLDRNGNWCNETLRITRRAENGKDVTADFALPAGTEASGERFEHAEN